MDEKRLREVDLLAAEAARAIALLSNSDAVKELLFLADEDERDLVLTRLPCERQKELQALLDSALNLQHQEGDASRCNGPQQSAQADRRLCSFESFAVVDSRWCNSCSQISQKQLQHRLTAAHAHSIASKSSGRRRRRRHRQTASDLSCWSGTSDEHGILQHDQAPAGALLRAVSASGKKLSRCSSAGGTPLMWWNASSPDVTTMEEELQNALKGDLSWWNSPPPESFQEELQTAKEKLQHAKEEFRHARKAAELPHRRASAHSHSSATNRSRSNRQHQSSIREAPRQHHSSTSSTRTSPQQYHSSTTAPPQQQTIQAEFNISNAPAGASKERAEHPTGGRRLRTKSQPIPSLRAAAREGHPTGGRRLRTKSQPVSATLQAASLSSSSASMPSSSAPLLSARAGLPDRAVGGVAARSSSSTPKILKGERHIHWDKRDSCWRLCPRGKPSASFSTRPFLQQGLAAKVAVQKALDAAKAAKKDLIKRGVIKDEKPLRQFPQSNVKGVHWHERYNGWKVEINISGEKQVAWFRCKNNSPKVVLRARKKAEAKAFENYEKLRPHKDELPRKTKKKKKTNTKKRPAAAPELRKNIEKSAESTVKTKRRKKAGSKVPGIRRTGRHLKPSV
eukprot:TRINITY_DN21457_c0_g1_i1.p1 TRINITY_DN21457_c0_g1~~TRINITY_DN21457_c0_g1_i1.p1  ORF type:complete len:624 (+),score=149.44 TRINITY_DN21457_c0_g1_i1:74-1945(+)